MSNSLSEQLLKAGLVTEQQARKAKKGKHKKAKQRRPDATGAESREHAERVAREKADRDRELNQQRQAELTRKARQGEIAQLVAEHRMDRGQAEIAYHFVDGDKVKNIHVTAEQQRGLSRGQLVLLRWGERYELIPAQIADRILERDPGQVILRSDPAPERIDPEDPYADYPVPDDLMW